jgi:hypothetical protein
MSKLAISSWLSIASLGFYRGTKHYNRDYKKECIKYEERKDNKYYNGYKHKPLYLYTHCIGFGLFGVLFYANPITFIAALPKELYRLEVNIRGLNEEKEKDDYHDFF